MGCGQTAEAPEEPSVHRRGESGPQTQGSEDPQLVLGGSGLHLQVLRGDHGGRGAPRHPPARRAAAWARALTTPRPSEVPAAPGGSARTRSVSAGSAEPGTVREVEVVYFLYSVSISVSLLL